MDSTLHSEINKALIELQLPKLTKRHPEIINPVMKSLLELIINYEARVAEQEQQQQESEDEGSEGGPQEMKKSMADWMGELMDTSDDGEEPPEDPSNEELKADLAKSLVNQFSAQWAPPLEGIDTLDELYGEDHNLLSTQDSDGDPNTPQKQGNEDSGFALFDGIWKHSGWKQIKDLQVQLKDMRELRALMRSIGRRPSVEGKEMRKYPPQQPAKVKEAPMGVAMSPQAPTQVSGLRQSDALEGLLPSEMMLLAKLRHNSTTNLNSDNTYDNKNQDDERIEDDTLEGGIDAPSVAAKLNRRKLLFMAKRQEKRCVQPLH
jgi:hypothetical protein